MDRATAAMNRYRARTRRPRVRDRPRFLESEARLPEVSASRRILRPTILNTPSDSKAQQLQQLKNVSFTNLFENEVFFMGRRGFPDARASSDDLAPNSNMTLASFPAKFSLVRLNHAEMTKQTLMVF